MNYKFEVLTIRDISFNDDKGKHVDGMQLWLIGETDDESWNGWEVIKIWVPEGSNLESDVVDLHRGDHVQVSFDRRGKAKMITLL